MQGIGVIVGEVLSMGLLFRITANFEPWLAFATAGGVGLFFSFLFLIMVKEPTLREKVKVDFTAGLLTPMTPSRRVDPMAFEDETDRAISDEEFAKLSFCSKIGTLTRQVCTACAVNKTIPICFIGCSITKLYNILFSNFWLLFI